MGTTEFKPIISIKDLEKSFKSEKGELVPVFERLSLNVVQQEFLVVLGPTGCGKTTLINMIGRLLKQDNGVIEYSPALSGLKNVPCVFQHYTLFPWRTVLKNVAFALEVKKVNKKERLEKARELVDKVGLTGFENAYPHELSGGMRQRAAIAQALIQKPPLLLMDEPFGALDDGTRRDLQHELINIWQEHKLTIVFITHNIDEALLLADRIIILSSRPGRILKEIKLNQQHPRDTASEEFAKLFLDIKKSCG